MARSPWGYTYVSGYKPPSLSWKPYRLNDTAENEYIQWLAKERGWTKDEAYQYAYSQPHGRILEAQFFGSTPSYEKPKPINWRNVAREALECLKRGDRSTAINLLAKAA